LEPWGDTSIRLFARRGHVSLAWIPAGDRDLKSRYGQADVLSVPAVRKDGATISVEFTIVPLQSSGQMIGMVAIMRDVTRRFDEMRALKRKLAELAGAPIERP
jgi:hypothetical protein